MESSQRPLVKRIHWTNTFYLIAVPIAALILAPLYFSQVGWYWPTVLFAIAFGSLSSMSITGGYHRLFAHLSYEARFPVKLFFLLFGTSAFQGSVLQWATDHRRHHRFVDTPEDPHNIRQGFFWAHMGWLMFRDEKYAGQFVPDLEGDPWVRFQHQYFVPLALLMGFGFPTFIGWLMGDAVGGFVLGGVVRLAVANHLTFFINSLAHTAGNRPYNEIQTARDNVFLAFLTFGEGYHNFHHQFSADYRNGIRWYHWDPTKWMINVFSWMGCAHRLKRTPPIAILRASLSIEEERLVHRGAPLDRVQALRQRIEDAQNRWRTLKKDYQALKRNMQEQSRQKVQHMRAELKIAQLDFKFAIAQWSVLRRHLVVPAR